MKPKYPNPLEDEAEVVSGGGQDGVDGITLDVGEVIAVHSVARLDVADDRFDSGAALHLAFDGWCDMAFLTCGEDLELVLEASIVALVSGICQNALESCTGELLDVGQDGLKRVAVIGFTRQCLGMNGELAALAPVLCCGD